MWLSKSVAGKGGTNREICETGSVTIGGDGCAVMFSGEERGLTVVSPAGVVWLPENGQTVAALKSGDGERLIAGALGASAPEGMKGGELYLHSKGASIYIKNSGEIKVSGELDISGDVNITGNLYINGINIMAALAG